MSTSRAPLRHGERATWTTIPGPRTGTPLDPPARSGMARAARCRTLARVLRRSRYRAASARANDLPFESHGWLAGAINKIERAVAVC
jgi:hypothetical protein